MSKTRGPRRVWSALAVGVVGLTLTGCAGLHPGVAAEVGDETISMDKVDEIAADFCEAVEPQLEAQAETVAHGYFRGGIVGTLAMRSIADQVAQEYGVSASSDSYVQQLSDVRRGVQTLDEDLRDSIIEVETAPLYVQEIQTRVGEVVLDGQGEEEDFVAAGRDEFATWVAENDVEFDPAFNTVMKDGTIAQQDMGVSFAVSEAARGGLEQEPNSVLARRMPASHRCGR